MKRVASLLVVAGCFSCATGGAYRSERDRIEAEYERLFVPADAPLVTTFTRDQVDEFAHTLCGISLSSLKTASSAKRKECDTKFNAMNQARLAERYPAADRQALQLKCTAYPKECKDQATVERWIRASHNERLIQWRDSNIERIEAGSGVVGGPDPGAPLLELQRNLNQQNHQQLQLPQQCTMRTLPGGVVESVCNQ